MDKWCMVIFTITMVVVCITTSIKDIKRARRIAPYGKVFKEEFAKIIDNIYRAQKISKNEFISAFVNNVMFKVEVDEYKPMGLEYSTIPMYMCYDIYINGEIVCREHIIKELSKNKIWFEFSSKRKRDEIINIIKEADTPSKEMLKQSNKEMYERLGLASKSFFEYSFNNDTEDI